MVNEAGPSTSARQNNGGDLSALIDEIDDVDDDWLNQVDWNRKDDESVERVLNNSDHDFDGHSGSSWIFPIGFEKREYQLSISRSCLFNNTLVCLPTGLGKTFIASVVIYNFYRWFPRSKLIFMAPSRPLVDQQISACYDVVGIPSSESAVLTGKLSREKRLALWNSKRLFFATPQAVQGDLTDPSFPIHSVRLVVVDEAHKAKGKYAYCEVIKDIKAVSQKFRVLALSATPGKADDVIEVIQNLLISKIEVRSENSIDVRPYTFHKKIEVVRVPLGEIESIRDHFKQINEPNLRKLVESNAITANNFSKGWLIIQHKKFETSQANHPNRSEISKTFSMVISMLHSQELLERHGIHSFIKSFSDDNNKTKLKYFVSQNQELMSMIKELNKAYKDKDPLELNVHPLPNGEVPSIIDKQIDFGHPKFEILKRKITEYFNDGGTKVIIFCEFRDTVLMVYTLLLQLRPTCRPKMLVGQKGKATQKDQAAAMNDFRSNKVNVLVTTSVCEEGIDVGEVDMVICFDINTTNATRFVQRIGRTGRKRNGKVLILATEGKEEEMTRSVIESKDKLNKSIHTNKEIQKNLYKAAPRMVPNCYAPKCVETKFSIPVIEENKETKTTAKKTQVASKKRKNDAIPPPSQSVANFYKRVRRDSDETVTVNADNLTTVHELIKSPIPVIKAEKFNDIKKKYTRDVEAVISRVKEFENLALHLSIISIQHVDMITSMNKIANKPRSNQIPIDFSLDFDLLNEPLHGIKEEMNVKKIKETKLNEEAILFESQVNQFPESESRYGNQFTAPESPMFPLKRSPFQPIIQTPKNVIKFISPVPKASCKKKSPILGIARPSFANSPIARAFQKQRSHSSSTPVASRSSPSVSITESDNQSANEMSLFAEGSNKATTSALEFLGLTSVDDLFEGFSEEEGDLPSVEAEPNDKPEPEPVHKVNAKPIVQPTQTAQDSFYPRLLEEEDDIFLQVPLEPSVPKTFTKCEIDVDDLFDISDDDDQPGLNENICSPPSDSSQKTQIYEVEDLEISTNALQSSNESVDIIDSSVIRSPLKENLANMNTSIVTFRSPSPPKKCRPNVSKLMNSFKATNFLSPFPSTSTNSSVFHSPSPVAPSPISLKDQSSTSFNSPISSRVQKTKRIVIDDSDEASPLPVRKKTSKKRKRNCYLDTQAGVDGTDSSDEDEFNSLNEFIFDEISSHSMEDYEVDMQAKYLESLQSPSVRQMGNFKLPQLPPMQPRAMIFSQMPAEDDDWEMDSFVVDNDHELEQDSQFDELEIAERILKEKRRRAARQKNGIKRRKVVRDHESSEEDEELVKLRSEILSKTSS